MTSPSLSHARRVDAYYRTVSRWIEGETAERGDLPFWRKLAGEAGGPILELGCGTGRVTAALAAAGAAVTAVDLSATMLDRARRRGWGGTPVRLVRGDMRALPLTGRFALVAAADDPFTHLAEDGDRDRALAEVARVLEPGGRFVLDAFRMEEERFRRACGPGGWHGERTLEDGTVVRETWRCDAATHLCEASYTYLPVGAEAEHTAFLCRVWGDGELEARLRRAGLAPGERWGGYGGEPWTPSSPTLVMEATLPPS